LNLTVIVLAAGQGTRMKSNLPNVLHPVAGRPMVRYVVDAGRSLEPVRLVVVVRHSAEEVRQALGHDLTYVTQPEQLGTGHAVQQAEAVAAGQAGTVLVLHGNIPLSRPETLRQVVARHRADKAVATTVEAKAVTPQQQEIGDGGSAILCFQDKWLWLHLARLKQRPDGEYHLADLLALANEQGDLLTTLRVTDPLEVMGVDQRVKLARAEAEMRRRINEQWMLAGVTLIHPEATYIEAGVEIGADTVLWPNSLLQGGTRIGQNCSIGPGAVIRDSTIGDGCRVELAVVEQAVMDEGSNVGPFGHLRKGAHLGAGAHIGNFGEVKNSYLGPGAKMGHFSYLGDATVGAGANIGAGTITCNYDGQRKHPTTIGEGAFIGSDTLLVAPVEVGDGAKTGAGSVVTHDVPAGRVAYGVPARVQPVPPEQEAERSQGDER
jgi:bifunctional UDP-N-acetylglucosamine pyrophosphorylase/glucosamine-1-phosphate N-acetyltransferase